MTRDVDGDDNRRIRNAISDGLRVAYTEAEVREMAREEARNMLGSIGLDVVDFKAQAATAAEIGRWRETHATFTSVIKKVFLSAAGVIGAAIGGGVLFMLGRKS